MKHTGKQQEPGSSSTATKTAKKRSLEQARHLSALEHSQAFLISLGAQRQTGWRRDKHWGGRHGRSCMSWICLNRLPRTTLAPTRMRLGTSCILHFSLGEGSMEVDHCIQKVSITADLLDCCYHRLLPGYHSRIRRNRCTRTALQCTAELLIAVRPIECSRHLLSWTPYLPPIIELRQRIYHAWRTISPTSDTLSATLPSTFTQGVETFPARDAIRQTFSSLD